MDEAFSILNISHTASSDEIHDAYRRKVKECHPDIFDDPVEQNIAQGHLIKLNLAYKEALCYSSSRKPSLSVLSVFEAKEFAKKMIKLGNFDSALMHLNRSEKKDDEWYFLNGNILMQLRQYDEAHKSYRQAVSLDPEKKLYRQAAFDAALALKKSNNMSNKFGTWIRNNISSRKK